MTNHSDKLKSLAQEAQARAADLRDWFNPGLKDIPVETLKQRYCDEHSRFVRVDGLDIHYHDLGPVASGADKPPLLLIHGLMSSLHCWDGWMPTLSAIVGWSRWIFHPSPSPAPTPRACWMKPPTCSSCSGC